jgi:hypothetical protein
MRSNLAEQFPQSSPDNEIPQRESGVGLIADRKKREARERTALDKFGDKVAAKRAAGRAVDLSKEAVMELEDEDLVDIEEDESSAVSAQRGLAELSASDAKRYGKRKSFEPTVPVDLTEEAVMELEEGDLEDMGPAHVNELRTAKALRGHAERGAQERAVKATRSRIDAIEGRIKEHRSATERAKGETAMIEARRGMAEAEATSRKEAAAREAGRAEGERLVEARQRGYEGFVARDAEGRVIGLRSDLEQVPIDFAFQATAEGFNRLTAEVKETRSLTAEMAKNRLAQIQEETDRWNEQYQNAERAMAFHARPEAGEISVTYEEGDIRDEVSANPDLMVPNAFYEAPKEPEAVAVEHPMTKEDRIEAKKAEVRAEIAMIESQLKPANVDIRENRLREDMAVAEAKIETLKGELKMLKRASPQERDALKESIQEQEGHLRILHEELKVWRKDEDRPKEVRARKQVLLGRLQALKDELEDLNSVDVDLTELNASAQESEIPVDVDLSGMEEDVDLSEVEEDAAAKRKKAA